MTDLISLKAYNHYALLAESDGRSPTQDYPVTPVHYGTGEREEISQAAYRYMECCAERRRLIVEQQQLLNVLDILLTK